MLGTQPELNEASRPRLVLASASPRRKSLLESVGLHCEVLATDIDESVLPQETPHQYVSRMAQEKAKAAQHLLLQLDKQPHAILAADTIVTQANEVFGKPKDKNDAIRIWQQLSNSDHKVMSAVSLLACDSLETRVVTTQVHFGTISKDQMQNYWCSGEPADKAGAYAIQGYASAWVQRIDGSYSNVVGLPLYEVNELLSAINLNWL